MNTKIEKTIIHISEETDFHLELQRHFAATEYTLIANPDLEEVMHKLNDDVILILVSSQFETQNMYRFLKHLKDKGLNHIPIIALLSTKTSTHTKNTVKMGYNDYISRENDPIDIVNEVLDFLNKQSFEFQDISGISVAIIDDDSFHTYLIETVFKQREVNSIRKYKSGEAYMLSPEKFDVFIVDIVMEKISGIRVIQKIRKLYPDSLIIVVSAVADDRIITTAIEKGADDFIVKPINSKIFLAKISSMLHHRRKI